MEVFRDGEFVPIGGLESLLAKIDDGLSVLKGDPKSTETVRLALEQKQRTIQEANARYRVERQRAAGISDRFHEASLKDWKPQGGVQQDFGGELSAWAWRLARNNCPSLILTGGLGTGKTWLGCGVLNDWLDGQGEGLFCTAKAYTGRIKESYRKSAKEPESEILERHASTGLLVIDEVGRQFETEAEKLYLFDLVNERYGRRKPTLYLTNLDASGFSEFMGAAIMDRLRDGGGKILGLNWPSRRA